MWGTFVWCCPISYDIFACVQHRFGTWPMVGAFANVRAHMRAVCGAGLIQIVLGPTTKKIRRSDGKWLVIEITIANIVRRARFDKFDLARAAIARTRNPRLAAAARRGVARLGSARHGTARAGSPPKSRRIVISRIERARNIGADRSNKRRIGLFLSLLMAMARPGFISQSPALKSILLHLLYLLFPAIPAASVRYTRDTYTRSCHIARLSRTPKNVSRKLRK